MNKLPLAKTLKRHELKECLGIALISALIVFTLTNPRFVLGGIYNAVLFVFGGF